VRIVGTIFALAVLVVGAYLYAASSRDENRASGHVRNVERQAVDAAATANLEAAATQLEDFRAANATYAGATLTAAEEVVLVRADAASYCIQTGVGASVRHEPGPGGSVQPGPC
jgi:hypothetical protein